MAERSGENRKIVLISGGTGVGKDYVRLNALENLGLKDVSQFTTRPHRGEGKENKQPVSVDEYNQMLDRGELVGHHIEPSESGDLLYGYSLQQIEDALPTIVEVNVVTARHLVDELKEKGIEVTGWIGLYADDDYLIHNIGLRQDMSKEELETRLRKSHEISEAIQQRHEEGVLTHPTHVGWDNRETIAADITALVKELLEI